jgi:hypothetical protein
MWVSLPDYATSRFVCGWCKSTYVDLEGTIGFVDLWMKYFLAIFSMFSALSIPYIVAYDTVSERKRWT